MEDCLLMYQPHQHEQASLPLARRAPWHLAHSPHSCPLCQVDEPANPHGLEHAWRWLSRVLNALPATRVSAKALIFFLRPAGYAMHGR